MSDDSEVGARHEKHPALKNFNRTAFQAKFILKKTLKFAAIGAVVGLGGAAGLAVASLAAGGIWTPIVGAATYALSFIPGVGSFIGTHLGGMAGTVAMAAGGAGGLVGAGLGAISSFSDASEAADAEEDRLIARFEQSQARQERMEALASRRDQQARALERQGSAMRNPNMSIPRGRPAQGPAYS